ncbi:MAG: conjugal transfer protein TraX [Hyphomicrobiales bacterium]|nr:conjugal transfer protein TraX [Hyphomicrobiales bacterium]
MPISSEIEAVAPPGAAPERASGPVAQSDLELAKWIALVAMVVDHYGKIAEPGLYLETHAIGRVSFPLFAAIVGTRLALRPALGVRYLRHLLPWALASQPVYVVAGRAWTDGNILFTLLLGVLATLALGALAERPSWRPALGLGAILAAAMLVDFGPLGVAMVPATALLAARRPAAGPAVAGPLGLAANLAPLQLVDLASLLASPLLLLSQTVRLRLPRLPAPVFYGFYPAHLLALHLYDLYR